MQKRRLDISTKLLMDSGNKSYTHDVVGLEIPYNITSKDIAGLVQNSIRDLQAKISLVSLNKGVSNNG